MGVPYFFRWLCRRYPNILKTITTSNLNISLDNLYLDFNGILHSFFHPDNGDAPETMEQFMNGVVDYVDTLMALVRPSKLLYIALDGVPPRCKMNNQRTRRYLSTKNLSGNREDLEQPHDSQPPPVPVETERPEEALISELLLSDRNTISPGSLFMKTVSECLERYITERLQGRPEWSQLRVIFSDSNVPGEGEHKIMDFIRNQKQQPGYDPNTRHVFYGNDADIILLGLALHEPNFYILREVDMKRRRQYERPPPQPEKTEDPQVLHFQLKNQVTEEDIGKIEVPLIPIPPTTSKPKKPKKYNKKRPTYYRHRRVVYIGNLPYHINTEGKLKDLFPEHIKQEILQINLDTKTRKNGFAYIEFSSEEITEEVCLKVNGTVVSGNMLKIDRAALPPNFVLVKTDKITVPERDEGNNLHFEDFEYLKISVLRKYFEEVEFLDLKKSLTSPPFSYDLERIIDDFILITFFLGNDFLPAIPGITILDGGLEVLLDLYKRQLPTYGNYLTLNGQINFEILKKYLQDCALIEEKIFKRRWLIDQKKKINILRKAKGQTLDTYFDAIREKQLDNVQGLTNEGSDNFLYLLDIPDYDCYFIKKNLQPGQCIDGVNIIDTTEAIKFHTPEYQTNYYKVLFGEDSSSIRESISSSYFISLNHTYTYYMLSLPCWSTSYSYPYSPLFSTISSFVPDTLPPFEPSSPFLPFQHLLSILPATSYLSIPRPLRPLVLPSSPIYDLFPSTFTLDLAGCNSGGGWTGGRDGVVHLPTIDEKRILEAYHNATKQFPWTQNELLRNTNNNEKLFILQSDNIAPSKEQPIESKTESDPSTEWIELSLERNGITGLVKASSVNGPCYEFKLIEMDLEDLYGGTIYTTESIDELKKDTPQNSWAMYQRTRFKKINPNTNRKRPKRKKVPQRPFTGKGYSLIGSAIGKPTDITEALFPQEKPNHTYKLPILANQLPTTKISVKAFNGKNQVIELNLTHTVGDVYEAVRYYFPEGPEFRLMVTYPRKVLRDLGETVQAAGLLNSLLVQIKSD
eukprot:TRINITY_DN14308_c0_g3_i3.p1 TRINITY_DN14308_c0_g3~~TRINITY_DN14308_c0_g3_i3.p1  ORF type:complete len:1029 (+),score=289.96 TRINITY_DN14308_c0_g3_i3:12-3098(+)